MLASLEPFTLVDLDCHAVYGDINKKACRSIERSGIGNLSVLILTVLCFSFLCFLVHNDFFATLPEVHSFFSNEEVNKEVLFVSCNY